MDYSGIRQLFRPEAVAMKLKALPPLESPVMDSIFSNRQQIPLPVVGKHEVLPNVKELPLVRRGMSAYSVNDDRHELEFYEPYPVRFSHELSAMDMNNLRVLTGEGLDLWVTNKIDNMRTAYRKTCEAICSVVITTGKVSWPVKQNNASGQLGTYVVDFGAPLSVMPEKTWNATGVNIKDVYVTLKAMRKQLRLQGYGASVEIWAGSDTFEELVSIVQAHSEKSSIKVELREAEIVIAGLVIKERSEIYFDPATDTPVPTIPGNALLMIATDAGHRLVYCAVDDLDAKLQPMPFFVKPVQIADPSQIKLIAEGKPFPIANVKGICRAFVLS
jgi:hypothetical protein